MPRCCIFRSSTCEVQSPKLALASDGAAIDIGRRQPIRRTNLHLRRRHGELYHVQSADHPIRRPLNLDPGVVVVENRSSARGVPWGGRSSAPMLWVEPQGRGLTYRHWFHVAGLTATYTHQLRDDSVTMARQSSIKSFSGDAPQLVFPASRHPIIMPDVPKK